MLRILDARKKYGVVKIGSLPWRGSTSLANKCLFFLLKTVVLALLTHKNPNELVLSSISHPGTKCCVVTNDAAYCVLINPAAAAFRY